MCAISLNASCTVDQDSKRLEARPRGRKSRGRKSLKETVGIRSQAEKSEKCQAKKAREARDTRDAESREQIAEDEQRIESK
jgi:hypothetical protein